MSSRHNIKHTTVIRAPVQVAWASLINLDEWKEWNKWTLLEAKEGAVEGTRGKLKACYEGDDNWKTFDFVFGPVVTDHSMTWMGSVEPCLFSGRHTMRLEPIDSDSVRLVHEEEFGGLLPFLGLGLPYAKLKRNYLLINEAFKEHVQKKHKD